LVVTPQGFRQADRITVVLDRCDNAGPDEGIQWLDGVLLPDDSGRGNGRLGGSPVAMRRLAEYVPALKGMMAVYECDGRGVGRRIGEGEMLR
jgi:hypothetical protein